MRWLLTSVVALVAGFAGAALWNVSGLGEHATRDYLMAHPEVLPKAMEVLQQRDVEGRIGQSRAELERAFPGAVLGNPQGKVTLVEFTDYACGFCAKSVADVQALIAANPELRVVVREYPILRPESVDAARMALAAAEQGKFAAFHDAMFRIGQPSADTITAAAREAGLDLEKAQAGIRAGIYDAHLQSNATLAQNLGINGTPGWVTGNKILAGAVGREAIGAAIAEAQQS